MILITWFDGLDVIKVLLKIFALVFNQTMVTKPNFGL